MDDIHYVTELGCRLGEGVHGVTRSDVNGSGGGGVASRLQRLGCGSERCLVVVGEQHRVAGCLSAGDGLPDASCADHDDDTRIHASGHSALLNWISDIQLPSV